MELSTRDLRTVTRDAYPRRVTTYDRRRGLRTRRPARTTARRAAIAASLVGL